MDIYKTSYYTYELPPELIAQTPLQRRDSSRLMVLDRGADSLAHRSFSDLPDYLRSGDCLVIRDETPYDAEGLSELVTYLVKA